MTDDNLTEGPRHPDDEALSAALDGEASEADGAHVAGCRSCAERVRHFEAVRNAVAADVPTAPPAVETSVAAALAEWDTLPAFPATSVTPIGRGRRRYAPPAAWVGAAALVLVALAAVALVLRGGGGENMVATGGDARAERDTGTLSQSRTESGSGSAAAAPAGFGEHEETATLVSLLEADRYSAPLAADETAGDGSGDSNERELAADPCIGEGRQVAAGRARAVVATGPVIWRGEDAVVVVFALDGENRQLYVMAPDGCDVLAEQRY